MSRPRREGGGGVNDKDIQGYGDALFEALRTRRSIPPLTTTHAGISIDDRRDTKVPYESMTDDARRALSDLPECPRANMT